MNYLYSTYSQNISLGDVAKNFEITEVNVVASFRSAGIAADKIFSRDWRIGLIGIVDRTRDLTREAMYEDIVIDDEIRTFLSNRPEQISSQHLREYTLGAHLLGYLTEQSIGRNGTVGIYSGRSENAWGTQEADLTFRATGRGTVIPDVYPRAVVMGNVKPL